jgi:hypothetical protein
MVYTKDDFNARVDMVSKKSARQGRNALVARIDNNGVIYTKAKRRRKQMPIRGALLMVICLFCFKAFTLSTNGPAAYEDRLLTLKEGTAITALGARVLGIDPVTQFIADQVGPLFR